MSFFLSGHKNRLSTPIFKDNVACLGSESKLINCSYHQDTTEDSHSKVIIVNCAASSATEPSEQDSSLTISLTSLLVALGVCILLLSFVVIFYVVKRNLKSKIISLHKIIRQVIVSEFYF